jgi:cytochrome c556
MKNRFLTASIVTALAAGIMAPVAAHSDESGEKRFPESQYRHDLMEHFKYGIGNVVQIMKGESAHKDHLPKLAAIMADASSMVKDAFEKDTRAVSGMTEAKADIWENWDAYAEAADQFERDARNFADVAAATDDMGQIGAAFKQFARNCKSCHDDYKAD